MITATMTNIGILDSTALADLAADFSDTSYALAPESPELASEEEDCEL